MGHDFTTNEQFIPIGVSCPRCDEKLHEPTVSCPACGWEFCFSLDDGISEEKNDHYWVYWRNTQLADDDSQIKDSCKVAGQGDAQATNTNLAYKKVRVYELAKEAGMTSKVLTEKLLELGYDLKGPSSTVNEAVADDIRSRLFNKYLHPPKTQEKEIFTQNRVTIIRRRHN
ncbi:MAG: translation initiation factor IF-2 N-terminal domain-containing protein [Deltaproteobacteria bacterium]|nr:translation initiation factor IF-2 N-terminal domain-containing protein [Deltaproteobacteria bacterium]